MKSTVSRSFIAHTTHNSDAKTNEMLKIGHEENLENSIHIVGISSQVPECKVSNAF
jgi:hypothetical protein